MEETDGDQRAGDQGARVGQVMEQHMGDQGGRDRWGIKEQGIKVLEGSVNERCVCPTPPAHKALWRGGFGD